jgi:hypothetical protein
MRKPIECRTVKEYDDLMMYKMSAINTLPKIKESLAKLEMMLKKSADVSEIENEMLASHMRDLKSLGAFVEGVCEMRLSSEKLSQKDFRDEDYNRERNASRRERVANERKSFNFERDCGANF